MNRAELDRLNVALGREVTGTQILAGGFSHETSLLTLASGQTVVARLGGPDPVTEAAVMRAASHFVPVPEVLLVLPSDPAGGRPVMVVEHMAGTPLSEVLAGGFSTEDFAELGVAVGRVVAGIGAVSFDLPGFFAGADLGVRAQQPWSEQLPGFAADCMGAVPPARLEPATRAAWTELCAAHASDLAAVDEVAMLVHADINPKNLLVTRVGEGWLVDAVLDWEFSFSGPPCSDAANMARFGADYPAGFLTGFLTGFRTGFAQCQPAGLPPPEDWLYLGRVMDMFALSDLVTRPPGHPVADRASEVIRQWVGSGVPH